MYFYTLISVYYSGKIRFSSVFPWIYKKSLFPKKEGHMTIRFLNFIVDLHIIALRKYCVKRVFLSYNNMIYIALFYKIFICPHRIFSAF